MYDNINWKNQFIGRENELNHLLTTWKKVKEGKPYFTILVGDTGVGKTKLIQKLYNYISQSEKTTYWPKTLSSKGKKLIINPEFSENNISTDSIPWLWWGIRFLQKDIDIRNSSSLASELSSAVQNDLLPHILHILENEKKYGKKLAAGYSFLKSAIGVVDLFVTSGILSATSTIATTAKDFDIGLYEDTYDAYKGTKDSVSKTEPNNGLIIDRQDSSQKDMIDTILNYFENVVFSENGLNIPVIIILDDAQWIDVQSFLLIEKLYESAVQNNWPLYIIATHWKSEWKNNIQEKNTLPNLCISPEYEYLQNNFTQLPILVNKNPNEFSKLIMKALPGLTSNQCRMISDRVQGNFGFLNDLVDYMLDDTDFFKDDDCRGRLTQDGIEALEDIVNLEHFQLWEKKFNKLDKELKKVLSWSSYQGREFFHSVVEDIAKKIKDDTDTIKQLKYAREQYFLIESISKHLNDFPHTALYEIAFDRLKKKKHKSLEFKSYYGQVLTDWLLEKKYEDLSFSEREKFFLLVQKEIDNGMTFSKDYNFENLITFELLIIYNQTRQIDKLDMMVERLQTMEFDIESYQKVMMLSINTLIYFSRLNNAIQLLTMLIEYFDMKKNKSLDELIELIRNLISRGANFIILFNEEQARKDYQKVIDLIQDNKGNIEENEYASKINFLLASVYEARGQLDLNSGNFIEAINNYTKAIKIKEKFIISNNTDVQWLVNVYMTRGLSRRKDNDIEGAIKDYTLAINMGENFNQNLTKQEIPYNGITLSSCYMNRAVAYKLDDNIDKALIDYGIAIDIGKNLKNNLAEKFPPKIQVDLIRSYMNRANINMDDDPEQALNDNNIALDLSKDLELKLGKNFMPDMKRDLARIYFHISLLVIKYSLEEAYTNLCNSINIMENLKIDLGKNFSEEMEMNLHMYYEVQTVMMST